MTNKLTLFRISLLLTLGIGLLIADLYFSRQAAWALFLLYVLSALIQSWIMDGKNYDVRILGGAESKKSEELKSLFYCGSTIEAEKTDEEKKAVRNILDPRRSLYRRIAKYLLIAIYIYLTYRFRLSLKFWDSFFILGATGILISATTGHMLIALALNALVALPLAISLDGLSIPATLFYLFFLVSTFSLHRALEREEEEGHPPYKQALIAALSVFLLGSFISVIIPKPEITNDLGKIKKKTQSKAIGNGASSSHSVNEFPNKGGQSSLSPEEAKDLLKSLNLGKMDLSNAPANLEIPKGGNSTADPKYSSLPTQPNPKQEMSIEEAQKLLDSRPKPTDADQSKSADELKLPLKDAKEILEALPKSTSGDPAKKEELSRALSEGIKEAEKKGDGKVDLGAALKKATEAGTNKAISTAPLPPPKPVEKPKPFISEEFLKMLLKLWKPLVIGLGMVVIYLFIRKLIAKHDPEKLEKKRRRKLSREERNAFLEKLRNIERAKMSENEEVIARYHLFLELMALINFPKPESHPPEEFKDFLTPLFPKLQSPLTGVTDTFCDVYYGKWELKSGQMTKLRTDYESIVNSVVRS